MKHLLLASVAMAVPLSAQDNITPFDPSADSITIEKKGDWVHVSLATGTQAGERLIQARPDGRIGQKEVYLDYYFIKNLAASYRHIEPVTVTWKIPKTDWESWQTRSTLFIRKKEDVRLTPDQVRTIKEEWTLGILSKNPSSQAGGLSSPPSLPVMNLENENRR